MERAAKQNPAQLTSVIRFHLSELSARNGHHEFEHIARYVAKARIASNIVPSTGPVSAGGDGGRDFQTFETGGLNPFSPSSGFFARSSGTKSIVFGCSLEKKIERKIRSDVRTLGEQPDVDEVCYFCEANLPIAKQLKLIRELEQPGFKVQIFDGTAVSEWLAEPDIFWIAQEFLHLPANLSPQGQLEEAYENHRTLWDDRNPIPISRSDFLAVRAGLRKATFDEQARPDLLFWLEKMSRFIGDLSPRALVRDASYEIAVATLRGKGELNPAKGLVDDYFSDLGDHFSGGELTDAAVLLMYCFGALNLGQFEANVDELLRVRGKIAEQVAQCMSEEGIGPGRKASLLRLRGLLACIPNTAEMGFEGEDPYSFWHEMLDNVEKAPLYPLEDYADHLSAMAGHIGDNAKLRRLAARVDEMLIERLGGAGAAEKAIDRAFALLDRGETIAAIRELQRSKKRWFSGERLPGLVKILLLLAELYRSLGLAYASKYHAMVAAYIARYDNPAKVGEILPNALLELMDAEDSAGNSLGFLQLFPVFFEAHLRFSENPFELEKHPRLLQNFQQLSALLGFLSRGEPNAAVHFQGLTRDWPEELCSPIWSAAESPEGFWNQGTWANAWSDLEEALIDRPFGDLGKERRVSWEALGLKWRFAFCNAYHTVPMAEQLIAEFQAAACALGGKELGLLKGEVKIRVTIDDCVEEMKVIAIGKQSDCFDIRVPSGSRDINEIGGFIQAFTTVIYGFSVLPDGLLLAAIDEDVLHPLFVGRPYEELYREFVPLDLYAEATRVSASGLDPERSFNSRCGERVSWYDSDGPTYDCQDALEDIRHRYELIIGSLRYTIKRLIKDVSVRQRIEGLRHRGLKDWEILGVLSNVALNHRLPVPHEHDPQCYISAAHALMEKTEEAGEALSPEIFTDEAIQMCERMYLAAFLAGRELCPPSAVNFDAIEEFLVRRYHIRRDDVEHPNVFEWPDEQTLVA